MGVVVSPGIGVVQPVLDLIAGVGVGIDGVGEDVLVGVALCVGIEVGESVTVGVGVDTDEVGVKQGVVEVGVFPFPERVALSWDA
ncbi:hypothetical protein KSX_28670 [Ktedonospora formicarum]|uniref:Uncharacterized protein n=1 Tax=Ktedonospora formicarum TaxID=2778364 RepID=A0A8J3I3B9_9CHLR|nr:hypothetical protein KSX_28670 [Ktedonospora formicarum]